jgi:hypothetical protein
MTLVTVPELKEYFNVAADFPDGPIGESLVLGSNVVRKYVGVAVYADASSGTPADPLRAAMLKAAESRVAMYHLLLNASSGIRRGGLGRTEQDAAGPLGGAVINSYLSPKEIRELRSQFSEQALDLLSEYFDAENGVNVLDQAGIEVGRIVQSDLEPEFYLGSAYDDRNY